MRASRSLQDSRENGRALYSIRRAPPAPSGAGWRREPVRCVQGEWSAALDICAASGQFGDGMNAALEAEGLVKRYGARTAVDDLSFRVPQGSIYGVLGPNGAGKSSTLRMLVGVLRPSAGAVSILGGPPTRETMRRVGYLPEERGLYRAMSARSAIAYLARLKGV